MYTRYSCILLYTIERIPFDRLIFFFSLALFGFSINDAATSTAVQTQMAPDDIESIGTQKPRTRIPVAVDCSVTYELHYLVHV